MRRDIENKNPENTKDRKLLFCKQSRSAIIEKAERMHSAKKQANV